MITHERLLDVLHYNCYTGEFRAVITRGRRKHGEVAGAIDKSNGYVKILVDRKRYYAHRLAWFYVHKEWPPHEIDHKNRCRADNRIDNLRLASRTINAQNLPISKRNKSGFKGVWWDSRDGVWVSYINASGKRYILGRFTTIEAARKAREDAEINLHGVMARTM